MFAVCALPREAMQSLVASELDRFKKYIFLKLQCPHTHTHTNSKLRPKKKNGAWGIPFYSVSSSGCTFGVLGATRVFVLGLRRSLVFHNVFHVFQRNVWEGDGVTSASGGGCRVLATRAWEI